MVVRLDSLLSTGISDTPLSRGTPLFIPDVISMLPLMSLLEYRKSEKSNTHPCPESMGNTGTIWSHKQRRDPIVVSPSFS